MRKYTGPKAYWRLKVKERWAWRRAKVIHETDRYVFVRKEV